MRRLVTLALFASVVALPSSLAAQRGQAIPIPTHSKETDYYAWITQMSSGEMTWSQNSGDPVVGRRYRAAVLTSEIFSTLVIELVTLGTEGCCAKIVWSRSLDTEAFRRAFGVGGEFAGLVVTDWRSNRSFEFTIHRRRFLATIADGPSLGIQEL